MTDIVEVSYVSVWDGGFEITTDAKYNVKTKSVFDIESVEGVDEDGDEVEILDEEYVLLPTGEKLVVNEYNGEYRTQPPALILEGDDTSVQNLSRALLDIRFSEHVGVTIIDTGKIIIESNEKDDYDSIIELAKKCGLRSTSYNFQ